MGGWPNQTSRYGRILALRAALAGFVIAGVAAIPLAATSSRSAAGVAPAVQRISSDPFTNTAGQHQTQVEPDVVANGNTVVAAFQTGRMVSSTLGSTTIGWATSSDGGATWTHGFLPGLTVNSSPAGTFTGATDPTVTYDAAHNTWLIAALGVGTPSALIVSQSSDGLNWSTPIIVSSSQSPDKDWIVCDNGASSPRQGSCYAIYSEATSSNLLKASVSTDGGATWSTPVATVNSATGYDVQPVVQPDGTVVVVADQGTSIVSYRSADGGASWSAPQKFATMSTHGVTGGMRVRPKMSVGVDGAGKLYAVWADCRYRKLCAENDMVMSTSTDGLTWSAVTRIPLDDTTSTVDHFLPGLGVDPSTSGTTARLGLVFYNYPVTGCGGTGQPACQLNVSYSESADGGANWSEPQPLNATPMSPAWLPNAAFGRMVGDYFRVVFSSGNAVTVVAQANAPSGSTYDEAMYGAVIQPPGLVSPANTTAPSISGTAMEHNTLTASSGVWSGTRPSTYMYQWNRCDSSGANCVAIGGATSQKYFVATADVGSTLTVTVTATNIAGSSSMTADPTAAVVPGPPANTAKPTIAGSATEGSTLAANNGTWASYLPATYTVQWQRCNSAGSGCADIAGATGQTFVLSDADLGSRLRIVVTGTNSVGSTTVVSTVTAVVVVRIPTMTAPGPTTIFSPSFVVGWTVTNTTGWLASFDVQTRSAPYTAALPATYTPFQTATTTTSATFSGASPGNSYCFSARSNDVTTHSSAWSADRCASMPVDDTAMTPSGTWTTVTATNLYGGSASRSTTTGDTLTLTGVVAKRLSLVATTCTTCGTVQVFWNGTMVKQISLATSALTQRLLAIATFTTVQTGDVVIKVTSSGQNVDIDGLAVGPF